MEREPEMLGLTESIIHISGRGPSNSVRAKAKVERRVLTFDMHCFASDYYYLTSRSLLGTTYPPLHTLASQDVRRPSTPARDRLTSIHTSIHPTTSITQIRPKLDPLYRSRDSSTRYLHYNSRRDPRSSLVIPRSISRVQSHCPALGRQAE